MRRQVGSIGRKAGPSGLADLALTLRDLARDEDEEGRRALAWALVNGRAAPESAADRDYMLALAALCRALADAETDPTQGATRFHPHTECPGWAARETPRALIGGYLFYAPRATGQHDRKEL
ncbi:MAG: hypothetical protein CVT81_10925 [Alphaproteobacteria bacterium HGW-Alphaproteobacteria-3]|nr:MAG: hypothetical protein CVT81_10925 [Alphaproteobacteria bacterium HGW-Alphaproteobacteria-3]